jgi:hypothetical protein
MIDLPPANAPSQPLQVQQALLSLAAGSCLMAWAQVEHALHEILFDKSSANRGIKTDTSLLEAFGLQLSALRRD